MKVLYFMNHVDQGGAALALYDLIFEIKKEADITPIVITGKKNSLNKMLTDIGVENYSAPFKNFMSSYKEPTQIYKVLLKIRYILGLHLAIHKIEKSIDFSTVDIIHSNLNRIDIGTILAKKYNIPHIWHIREHADGRDFKLISVKKDSISYMNSFDSYFITISQSVKNAWNKKGLFIKNESLIYDGIRTELYNSEQDKSGKKVKMIFLGGYTKNKGQEDLIDALNDISESLKNKFVIDFYGNGKTEYVEYLNKKICKSDLSECMKIHSYQPDIWKKVPEYDVGLTCSRVEGFGRVTVEYMMSGLCPIVSDSGANLEIVQDRKNGIIYKALNGDALKAAIIWAVNNRKTVNKIGLAAEAYAKKNFSMEKKKKRVKKLYLKALEDNKNE